MSAARTRAWAENPLPILLDSYERYGPVFTLRLFHSNIVFMLGPAANHYITVSHASNFSWREGSFRDLIGLMGDGLLTIDGEFHRRSRMIMLPAFHRESIAASADAVIEETTRALAAAGAGRVDRPLRVDPAPGCAGRDALPVRDRSRRRAGPLDRLRGAVRGRARVLRERVRAARVPRALLAVGEDAERGAPPRHADLRGDHAQAARRASAAATSSACCSTPRTRTATRSPTRRSATR